MMGLPQFFEMRAAPGPWVGRALPGGARRAGGLRQVMSRFFLCAFLLLGMSSQGHAENGLDRGRWIIDACVRLPIASIDGLVAELGFEGGGTEAPSGLNISAAALKRIVVSYKMPLWNKNEWPEIWTTERADAEVFLLKPATGLSKNRVRRFWSHPDGSSLIVTTNERRGKISVVCDFALTGGDVSDFLETAVRISNTGSDRHITEFGLTVPDDDGLPQSLDGAKINPSVLAEGIGEPFDFTWLVTIASAREILE